MCFGTTFRSRFTTPTYRQARGIIKPHAFEAIRRRVDVATELSQILCGDFNTPLKEDDDGVTTTDTRRLRRCGTKLNRASSSTLGFATFIESFGGEESHPLGLIALRVVPSGMTTSS